MKTVYYGRGGRGFSLNDTDWLQQSIFIRDHHDLMTPWGYSDTERKRASERRLEAGWTAAMKPANGATA